MENKSSRDDLQHMIEHATHITFRFGPGDGEYADLRGQYPECTYCDARTYALVQSAEMQQNFALGEDLLQAEFDSLANS